MKVLKQFDFKREVAHLKTGLLSLFCAVEKKDYFLKSFGYVFGTISNS